MGTGTFAEQCRRYFPSSRLTGVEIDEKIISLSRQYFGLPEEIPVVAYDGRAFLQSDTGLYDVVMVDAFRDITIPFQMSSVEFFRLVDQHLAPGGVVSVNLNMRTGGQGNINEHLIDTIASVLPAVRVVAVTGDTNLALFAARDEDTLKKLPQKAAALPDGELSSLMRRVAATWESPPRGGNILTDDRAPVELLGMRAIDAIIQEELRHYKEIYRQDGMEGLRRAL